MLTNSNEATSQNHIQCNDNTQYHSQLAKGDSQRLLTQDSPSSHQPTEPTVPVNSEENAKDNRKSSYPKIKYLACLWVQSTTSVKKKIFWTIFGQKLVVPICYINNTQPSQLPFKFPAPSALICFSILILLPLTYCTFSLEQFFLFLEFSHFFPTLHLNILCIFQVTVYPSLMVPLDHQKGSFLHCLPKAQP